MAERILIVRSARDHLLGYAGRLLRWRHPGAALAVLCQPEHGRRVSELVQPDRVFFYPEKHFTAAGLPEDLRRELQQSAFSEVVVLYHNAGGEGYPPVHRMVRRFHRGPVGIVNRDGRYSRFARLDPEAILAGAGIVGAAAVGALAALGTALATRGKARD